MKFVVKDSHYIRGKKLNIKRIICLSTIGVSILLFSIFIITKQNKPVDKVADNNQTENFIVVETTGTNNNSSENEQNASKQNDDGQTTGLQTVGEQNANGQGTTQTKLHTDFSALTTDELQQFDKIYGTSDPKRIFLTFDDGPTKQVTPYILDLLKSENIKATFFVLGSRVELNPDLVKREYEEGHFIANHSYSHNYSSIYQNIDTVLNEYNQTTELVRKALENENYNSLVFRFPGGSVGGTYDSLKKSAKQALRERGIVSIDWNALTGDAEGIKTKEGLYNRFLQTASGKSSIVLLMHDAADKILTYETLPSIIAYCRENGYEFKNMYDLMLREE